MLKKKIKIQTALTLPAKSNLQVENKIGPNATLYS
jgi:hypothetical protein